MLSLSAMVICGLCLLATSGHAFAEAAGPNVRVDPKTKELVITTPDGKERRIPMKGGSVLVRVENGNMDVEQGAGGLDEVNKRLRERLKQGGFAGGQPDPGAQAKPKVQPVWKGASKACALYDLGEGLGFSIGVEGTKLPVLFLIDTTRTTSVCSRDLAKALSLENDPVYLHLQGGGCRIPVQATVGELGLDENLAASLRSKHPDAVLGGVIGIAPIFEQYRLTFDLPAGHLRIDPPAHADDAIFRTADARIQDGRIQILGSLNGGKPRYLVFHTGFGGTARVRAEKGERLDDQALQVAGSPVTGLPLEAVSPAMLNNALPAEAKSAEEVIGLLGLGLLRRFTLEIDVVNGAARVIGATADPSGKKANAVVEEEEE